MKILFLCLSFFCVVENVAAELSLDQLFAMQTLMRVKLDGQVVCEEEFNDVSPLAITAIPQLLEAEVQARIGRMKEVGTFVAYITDDSRQKSCRQKCRCDLYSMALGSTSEKKSPVLRPAQFLRCAKANEKWICKNQLFRKLLDETKKATQ